MRCLIALSFITLLCSSCSASSSGVEGEGEASAEGEGEGEGEGEPCQTVDGSVTVEDALDVAGLVNVCEVTGDVIITGEEVDNLNGLERLAIVGGNFEISDTTLVSLNGLGVVSVGRALDIHGNADLASIEALSTLSTVELAIDIRDCPALVDLRGLDGIVSITGVEPVQGGEILGQVRVVNTGITSLAGLDALSTLNGAIEIHDNESLVDVDGLSSLTSVGILAILSNQTLANLDGLAALTEITNATDVQIQDNIALPQCAADAVAVQVGATCNCFNNANTGACP